MLRETRQLRHGHHVEQLVGTRTESKHRTTALSGGRGDEKDPAEETRRSSEGGELKRSEALEGGAGPLESITSSSSSS